MAVRARGIFAFASLFALSGLGLGAPAVAQESVDELDSLTCEELREVIETASDQDVVDAAEEEFATRCGAVGGGSASSSEIASAEVTLDNATCMAIDGSYAPQANFGDPPMPSAVFDPASQQLEFLIDTSGSVVSGYDVDWGDGSVEDNYTNDPDVGTNVWSSDVGWTLTPVNPGARYELVHTYGTGAPATYASVRFKAIFVSGDAQTRMDCTGVFGVALRSIATTADEDRGGETGGVPTDPETGAPLPGADADEGTGSDGDAPVPVIALVGGLIVLGVGLWLEATPSGKARIDRIRKANARLGNLIGGAVLGGIGLGVVGAAGGAVVGGLPGAAAGLWLGIVVGAFAGGAYGATRDV